MSIEQPLRLTAKWLAAAALVGTLFLQSAPAWCAVPIINDLSAIDQSAVLQEGVARIVAESDDGKDVGSLVSDLADLGSEAAIECAKHLSADHPARNAALLEVIAQAGQGRRSHGELLKLYDPAAYRLYYTPEGAADQALIGKALDLATWPDKLPEAMVRAAPLATMKWMREQAASAKPRSAELLLIWQTWGFWVRVGHERQWADELGSVIDALIKNRAILDDPLAAAGLLKFAGETKATSAEPFVIKSLSAPLPAIRAEAASACRRLATEPAALAIIEAAGREEDGGVQSKIATASDAWPARDDVGAAMLKLFNRSENASARSEILFSCSKATWPARSDLLLRAFDEPADGVLNAAFTALSVKPDPKSLAKTLEVARQTPDADPALIDALGAFGDRRAVSHLVRWLSKQENPVVRVKLLLALEKTADHEADGLLLQLVNADNSAMVVEQVIGIIARKKITGAEDVLTSLSLDATAPMQLRIQAIWAMGHFDTPEVKDTLDTLLRTSDELFKSAIDARGRPAFSEAVDVARMMVALAKIQMNDPVGDASLQAAFDRGTGVAQMTALVMLAEIRHDHPIISQGLKSTDTAILYGAAKAAMANPQKYHDALVALRTGPFVSVLLQSGLDSSNLRTALDAAIAAGVKP